MTITVGEEVVTYDIQPANETIPRYELSIRYQQGGIDDLARIELPVDSRRDVTKVQIEESLCAWSQENPRAQVLEYAVLEIAVCRSGSAAAHKETVGTVSHDAPRHPRRLRAADDNWREPDYTEGDEVIVNLGGAHSSVYGSTSGTVMGTSGSADTYWVDIDGERKRIPERWIGGLVDN